MILLFLCSIAFCLYTYALFPLVLHWRARLHARKHAATESNEHSGLEVACSTPVLPSVSIVVAVHNEADRLAAKIASLDALNYPEHLLECVFVSDGSTDNTVSLLTDACASRALWDVRSYDVGAGKPTALNLGVEHAGGDILIFMDARQTVSADAVTALVARLQDPTVGAVSGELVLTDTLGAPTDNVGLYWRYEKWIRKNESELFSTTGATGALYAVRRNDFEPLASDTLLDDFDIPIRLLRRGKRTVFEPAARAYDQPEVKTSDEFRRKARTLAGNYQSFSRNRWLFNPAENPVWWQFMSHKVFRLLVPYALLFALFASIASNHEFLNTMLVAQVEFYVLGLLGAIGFRNRISSSINLFLQLNAAAVVGAYRAIRGGSTIRWKSS